MPYSVPVSKLMIKPGDWPILPAEADIESAIKVLRIINEEKKLQQGHSTPLVLDPESDVIGFVHLVDLLREIRHLCQTQDAPCEAKKTAKSVRDLVVPFAGTVGPDDPILKALDIMMEHKVSLVPVLVNNKLEGVVKLSDVFNTVASILFDEEIVDQKEVLMRRFHL